MKLQYFLIALILSIPIVVAENNTPRQLPVQTLPNINLNFTLNKTQKPSEINNLPYTSPDMTVKTGNKICFNKNDFYITIGIIFVAIIGIFAYFYLRTRLF